MVVCHRVVVKDVYKHQVICYKAARDVWIRKAINWCWIIIKTKNVIDDQSCILCFLLCPLIFIERSKFEQTVIIIGNCVLRSIFVLSNILHFNVAIVCTSKFFHVNKLVCLKAKLSDVIFGVVFACNGDNSCWIIWQNHRNNWPIRINLWLLNQIIKNVLVLFPLGKLRWSSKASIRLCKKFVFIAFFLLNSTLLWARTNRISHTALLQFNFTLIDFIMLM